MKGFETSELKALLEQLRELRGQLARFEERSRELLDAAHSACRESARNLLHYLALRRQDLRPLQEALAQVGLSSLGRAEAHVLATLDAVLRNLHALLGLAWAEPEAERLEVAEGHRLLAQHTEALLGPAPAQRDVRILVTMPGEAADDPRLILELMRRGMDCLRINCAHDEPGLWSRILENLRAAEAATGRRCRVLMDLAGPKLRTGPIEPGARVAKIRPERDVFGKVTAPARVWLTPQESPSAAMSEAQATLPLPAAWLRSLEPGDLVRFTDAREARRSLTIVDVTAEGCWAESRRTAYVVPGTRLERAAGRDVRHGESARVGELPPRAGVLVLRRGDLLILTLDERPGRPASFDSQGRVLSPASIGCTLPEVFEDVRAGERIWFDDGKIGGVLEKLERGKAWIRIVQARPEGSSLASDKGINLPDSSLPPMALTPKDIEDLEFVARHADLVALSFASGVEDVRRLQEALERLAGPAAPAIVLKIETRRGFDNLSAMLLQAMRGPSCGVMIARGDLAIESGFERLAEVQEEILWICEAAHVPVIWATQVLESLAKQGLPSRAEITDAAMSHRAECVMLNKGPYVQEAVAALSDILHRMQAHQRKKQSMLRELSVASRFPG